MPPTTTTILTPRQAFCSHGPTSLQRHTEGRLANVPLAVKDLFQLAGERNGAGNPSWLEHQPVATTTASSLSKLLDAGAHFIGFTHTDEMAYSLEGNNYHYGISDNPALPGYHCGGSSMGSAAVVAAKLADIALGTDTGGSVRVPASYCGLFGFRPSKGAIDKTGLLPLAPEFDTIGWFCRDSQLLATVGDLLLDNPQQQQAANFERLIIVPEFLALATPAVQSSIEDSLAKCRPFYDTCVIESIKAAALLAELPEAFRFLQGRNAAETHEQWLKTSPNLSPPIQARFAMALAVTDTQVDWARRIQREWIDCLSDFITASDTVVLPTTPSAAPKIGQPLSHLRQPLIQLTAISGLAGLPQCHLPLSTCLEHGISKPCGLSLLKRQGFDRDLLHEVESLGH